MLPLAMAALLSAGAVDDASLQTITNVLTVKVSTEGHDVISSADVRRALEFESEKATMGCSSEDSCIAEIAGALGARWVVFGSVGDIDGQLIATLGLFDSEEARTTARQVVRADTRRELLDGVENATPLLLASLSKAKVVVLDLKREAESSPTAVSASAPVGFAEVLIATGGLTILTSGVVATVGLLGRTTGEFSNDADVLFVVAGVATLVGAVALVPGLYLKYGVDTGADESAQPESNADTERTLPNSASSGDASPESVVVPENGPGVCAWLLSDSVGRTTAAMTAALNEFAKTTTRLSTASGGSREALVLDAETAGQKAGTIVREYEALLVTLLAEQKPQRELEREVVEQLRTTLEGPLQDVLVLLEHESLIQIRTDSSELLEFTASRTFELLGEVSTEIERSKTGCAGEVGF